MVIEQEQKAVGMKTYVKELETKIIFLENDKECREKDLKDIEDRIDKMVEKSKQTNNSH